jgi:hypothetical protein
MTITPPVATPNNTEIRRARALARALDTVVGIPGTPLRIGLDAILGLIPGAGDVAGAVLSAYIVLIASKNGAPPAVLWRMVANIAIDTAIGAIPVLGDLFDVAWKSNIKNVELLEHFTAQPQKATTRSRALGFLVVTVVLLALIGLGALGVFVARAIWQLLTA